MYTSMTYKNLKALFPQLNAQLFNSSHRYRQQVLDMLSKQESNLLALNEQFMGERSEAKREEVCELGYN